MRASTTHNGLTVRVIAGTYNALIGIDLQESKRAGCLGFSIRRTDLTPGKAKPGAANKTTRWLPNLLTFPKPKSKPDGTTLDSPLQKFRWGDYTLTPGARYRYQVVARYGTPGALKPASNQITEADGVTVEVTAEDNKKEHTAIFFNRGAAASKAYNEKFGNTDFTKDTAQAKAARQWLSRGMEEAAMEFMGRAKDKNFALHAAIYEFQKPELLAALRAAKQRGAEVIAVFHARHQGEKDKTLGKNSEAIRKAGIGDIVVPRRSDPQGAIMHNKFVVLLERQGGKLVPVAVWTGSMNWTDGGVYGQLNVGHAIYDPQVALAYETYFQLLKDDASSSTMKRELEKLTPVSVVVPGGHVTVPIFSPQGNDAMLHLYSAIVERAKCLLVSAPFALSPIILKPLTRSGPGVMRYMLLDKEGSLGKGEQVHVIERQPGTSIGIAATVKSPLMDMQHNLLLDKESYHHAGIHIHSKIILADPFGTDPILVTGSANFSRGSTEVNDSNSLIIRGDTAAADIYSTEFMRMFEHYHFRAALSEKTRKAVARNAPAKPTDVLSLKPDDSWTDPYYVHGSDEESDRRLFAGTHA